MVEWYHSVYDRAGKIEGASQRVQEDTIKFYTYYGSVWVLVLLKLLMVLVRIYANLTWFIYWYSNFLFW